MSCQKCTGELAQRRRLRYQVGDLLWCSGFGPRWPARVASIGFDGPQDLECYGVNFLGESSGAWVAESQLWPWGSEIKKVPERWRRRFAKAMKAAKEFGA